jgi:hypothetical protein|tara:strand:+ start:422 stop:607 length:186 start_codon:yes stop_codon:yes gene_type:complete
MKGFQFRGENMDTGKDKHGLPIESPLSLKLSSLSSRAGLAMDDLIAPPVRVALVGMEGLFK